MVLAAIVVAQALINWHFASRSFFYADDFVAFQDALRGHYRPDFLFAIHGGHLSPGRRALTLYLQYHANLDYDFALGVLLAAHSISVVLVQRILRLLFGARWWTLAVAFAYGVSIVVQPALQWYSAGVLILPSTTFGLAAVHAYLCWWRTGRRAWLVWSVVAVTGGLLFYIKALLVPVYAILIRVFLLESGRPLRETARAAVREWRVWALYAVPVVAAVALYLAQGSGTSASGIALHTVVDYFRTAWSAGFVPALFGIRVPVYGDAAFHNVAVVGCQVAIVAAAALSIARRRSAWRPWALVGLVFVLNAVLVFPRLGFGPVIGYELRYLAETAWFAAIVLPFAFALPRTRDAPAGHLERPRTRWLAPAAAALAAYTAFAWASDAAFTRHWPGAKSAGWVGHVRDGLNALPRRGAGPVVLEDAVPAYVLPFWVAPGRNPPANLLSAFLPVFHRGLRFDELADETYRIGPGGSVEAVRFVAVATGLGKRTCLGGPAEPDTYEWRPAKPLGPRHWYLRVTYRSRSRTAPRLSLDPGAGYSGFGLLAPRPQEGTSQVALGPYGTTPTVAGVRLAVAPGERACLTRLAVGSFAPR